MRPAAGGRPSQGGVRGRLLRARHPSVPRRRPGSGPEAAPDPRPLRPHRKGKQQAQTRSLVTICRKVWLQSAEMRGFPAALARPTPNRRSAWYRDFVDTIIQRDVSSGQTSEFAGLPELKELLLHSDAAIGGSGPVLPWPYRKCLFKYIVNKWYRNCDELFEILSALFKSDMPPS